MNKINRLFNEKKNNILSIYFTSGFPKLNDTAKILQHLEESGVDLIEIGIPFSDPLADGPVIQHSSEIALTNGMNLKLLFEQIEAYRITNPHAQIPLILMGYLNPIIQFGIEKFCKKAKDCGISGIIIPDLPLQEYLDDYKRLFEKHDLKNILLITPQTSEERVKLIDQHSTSFIYMVSSSSTTGSKGVMSEEQLTYFNRIKNYSLNNPTLIGFGISNNQSYEQACAQSNGAIIGSAFINAIKETMDLKKDISAFIYSIKNSILV